MRMVIGRWKGGRGHAHEDRELEWIPHQNSKYNEELEKAKEKLKICPSGGEGDPLQAELLCNLESKRNNFLINKNHVFFCLNSKSLNSNLIDYF